MGGEATCHLCFPTWTLPPHLESQAKGVFPLYVNFVFCGLLNLMSFSCVGYVPLVPASPSSPIPFLPVENMRDIFRSMLIVLVLVTLGVLLCRMCMKIAAFPVLLAEQAAFSSQILIF